MYTFELHRLTFKVEHHPDFDADAPWDQCELLGSVDDGNRSKRPGEIVINHDRSGWRRFYDFAGAVAKARAEGLPGERAAEAARRECDWLRGWCRDEWNYIGVTVTLLDAEGNPTEYSDSCWGVEDNGDHAQVIANDLALTIGARVNWDDVIEVPARTIVLRAPKVAA